MSSERLRVHIDDRTGRQLASPDDAESGGSHQLQGKEAEQWLAQNPDKRLRPPAEPPDSKEAEKPEDKAVGKPQTKAKS